MRKDAFNIWDYLSINFIIVNVYLSFYLTTSFQPLMYTVSRCEDDH